MVCFRYIIVNALYKMMIILMMLIIINSYYNFDNILIYKIKK